MKNRLLLVVALMATTFLSITAKAQTQNYYFSATAPSGQTLYYMINYSRYSIDPTVSVVGPNQSTTNPWSGYTKPIGDLIIPDNVSYNGFVFPVTNIDNYAFMDCEDLTSVLIGDSVTSIGAYAFHGCGRITSVRISSHVASIGEDPWGGCSNLSSIIVDSGNIVYDSRENCNAIIHSATNTLVAGCHSTIIPNTVVSIGINAFCCDTNLMSITIPNSVTRIGNYIFYQCSRLTSIISLSIVPPSIDRYTFLTVPTNTTLYVPCVSLSAYRATSGWNNFKDIRSIDCGSAVITTCDSCVWHDNTYHSSGIYVAGSDTLWLTINHSTTGIDSMSVCNSFRWYNGRLYTTPNTTDTIHRVNYVGCDSLVTLNLSVRHSSISVIQDTVVENQLPRTIFIGNKYCTFNDSVLNFEQYIPNGNNCDSLVIYSLYVYRNIYDTVDTNICNFSLPFTWCGHRFLGNDIHTATFRGWHGEDSTVTLRVHVGIASREYRCDIIYRRELPWTLPNGTVCHGDTNFLFITQNHWGCDSLIVYALFVRRYENIVSRTICDDSLPYLWDDLYFEQAGSQYKTYVAHDGRDSVVMYDLTIKHGTSSNDIQAACDSYTWIDGQTYDVDTSVSFVMNNAVGCDSLVNLNLTIHHNSSTSETITTNVGYVWVNHGNSNLYTTSGTYFSNYNTTEGCPSVDTLYLTINATFTSYDTVYLTNYIHDTTIVNNYIYDTTVVNNYIHDTVLVQGSGSDTVWMGGTHTVYIYDTLYRNVYLHVRDTVIVDHYHDTLVLERTIVDYIHDTAYINLYIHDTTVVTDYVHDTTIIDNYIYDTLTVTNHVHDTAYITTMVYDTLYVDTNTHDTVWLTRTVHEYIHDTVYRTVNHYIHDTTFVINYVHDTAYINRYIHDTTFVHNYIHDTLYLYRYLHDTIYIHDTVYIHGEGISAADVVNAKVYSSRGQVVVEGADGNAVTLYDLSGRTIATRRDEQEPLRFDVPASGAYLIKIGRHAPRKVVVIK